MSRPYYNKSNTYPHVYSQPYSRNENYQGPPPQINTSFYDNKPSKPKYDFYGPKEFGHDDCLTFGKHKGKSIYEVANEGDFGYLKWLQKGKFYDEFKLNSSCTPHLLCAINHEKDTGKWEKETDKATNLYWWSLKEGDNIKVKTECILEHQ